MGTSHWSYLWPPTMDRSINLLLVLKKCCYYEQTFAFMGPLMFHRSVVRASDRVTFIPVKPADCTILVRMIDSRLFGCGAEPFIRIWSAVSTCSDFGLDVSYVRNQERRVNIERYHALGMTYSAKVRCCLRPKDALFKSLHIVNDENLPSDSEHIYP